MQYYYDLVQEISSTSSKSVFPTADALLGLTPPLELMKLVFVLAEEVPVDSSSSWDLLCLLQCLGRPDTFLLSFIFYLSESSFHIPSLSPPSL